jgi:uncharacterized protein with ATP-grasp and redox domains
LPEFNPEDAFFANSFSTYVEEEQIEASLANIERLSEKTKEPRHYEEDIKSLKKRLDDFKDADTKLTRMATPTTVPKSPKEQERFYRDLWQKVAAAEGNLSTTLVSLRNDTDKEVEQIWARAEVERQEKEKLYESLKHASWVLYALALLVAISAKIFGVEVASVDS